MRHALLGGTFDPIHSGHIHAAKELAKVCQLDRVTLLPSALPPHKLNKTITVFKHRYKMASLAIKDEPLFQISDYENQTKGPSYTINTALHFKKLHPNDKLFFIMGNDMAGIFSTWKSWRKLLEIIEPLIVIRPGETQEIDYALPIAIQKKLKSYYHKINTLAISSTMIREDIYKHTDMLNPTVIKYIKEQNLYMQKLS